LFFYSSASTDHPVKPHSQKENIMNAITSFIKRHPQVTFWSIAITTFFVSAFLSDVGLWGLLIYGTFLGAVLVTGVVDGRSGLKEYFSRIVRWRVGLKWYAVALLLPLVLNLTAFGINIASGAPLPTTPQWPAWTAILGAFFWPGLLAIALTEEPSFTGFALPRFLIGRTALAAALIVGLLRTLWHLPFFIGMLSEGYFIGMLNLALMVMSGAVMFTWLFNKTNGSVLIPMLLHASLDVISGDGSPLTLGPLFSRFLEADLVRQDILQAAVFVVAAVLIIFLTRFALGRKPEAAMDTMVAEQPMVAD
jgi:membrane protease YdiL (CAAX protease family)